MNEVKKPKKPLLYYYGIVLLVILLLNVIVMPAIRQLQIKEVDYGTFMTMVNEKKVGKVEVQDNRILFTDKDGKNIYKTGKMDDPGLTERLYLSGAQFTQEIVEQMSPILSFILSWVLPIAIFFILGQFLSKKMTEKMTGGSSSMMFNLGKSNAKVYVKSSDGIKFSDVAGEDEAKENLAEIVEYLHNPQKYTSIGASMPKGVLPCWPSGNG